jgi:hypothetical protein
MNRGCVLKALLVIVLIAMPSAAYGCSGGLVTNTYEFSDFTRLDIQNAFNAQVIQSAMFSITITSSKALLDYLSVTTEGETVTIKLQPNHPFTDFVLMRKTLKVKVTMPVLQGLALSGACECVVKGFESTNRLDLDVSGASTMNLDSIEIGNADFTVSGASKLEGKVTAVNLNLDISGASRVDLSGNGEDILLAASGYSRVNLEQFVNQTTTVSLSGASEATVDTRKHLDFSLIGASRLFFLSNPSMGKMEVLGASTVKHK